MEPTTLSTVTPFFVSLIAGGIAGTTVDIALFPLDTLKTRMQSAQGFVKAGGFRGVYSGLYAAAGGSAPGAALFFGTYEFTKGKLYKIVPPDSHYASVVHMAAGATGETLACLVRVPTENVKQKMQARMFNSIKTTAQSIIKTQGLSGFYTGYSTTLLREIPFALVQFPIYEKAKRVWSTYQGHTVSPLQAALCGSFAGGVAAGVTTPMDVIKTRLMLGVDAKGVHYKGMVDTIRRVYTEEGRWKFFSGMGPRIMWISIGGSFFLEPMRQVEKY